jgi:NAD(P)H-flavin reductase
MAAEKVEIIEVRHEPSGIRGARFEAGVLAGARPGQYVQAHLEVDTAAAAPISLYHVGLPDDRLFFGPVPDDWLPGRRVWLRGPLGKGFYLPQGVKRLALTAVGGTADRLLPLTGLAEGAAVALFTDGPVSGLPAAFEVSPLAALKENIAWPDFIALDVPLEVVGQLPGLTGLSSRTPPPCPVQALVTAPMPCGGLAQCGVCAVSTGRGRYKLVCEDGPVIDWESLFFPQSRRGR